jgi:hypothetical protein
MSWGLFPLFATRLVEQVASLRDLSGNVGCGQLGTGALSDVVGRVAHCRGMWVQALGIAIVILSSLQRLCAEPRFSELAPPWSIRRCRPSSETSRIVVATSSIGVYRFWRDMGYAVGAVVAGVAADALGLRGAMWIVAALTFASGLFVAVRMTETLAPHQQELNGVVGVNIFARKP